MGSGLQGKQVFQNFWSEQILQISVTGLEVKFLNPQRRPAHMCSANWYSFPHKDHAIHFTFSLVGSSYTCTTNWPLRSSWRKWLVGPMLRDRNLMPKVKHFLLFEVWKASGEPQAWDTCDHHLACCDWRNVDLLSPRPSFWLYFSFLLPFKK